MTNYNINRLKKVFAIQEYYLQKRKLGLPRIRIYENVVRLFPMSISTFDNYLSENVRRDLSDFNFEKKELIKYSNNVIEAIQKLEKPFV